MEAPPFLTSALHESCQLHAPLVSPERKSRWYPLYRTLGGPVCEEGNILLVLGIEPQFHGRWTRSLVTKNGATEVTTSVIQTSVSLSPPPSLPHPYPYSLPTFTFVCATPLFCIKTVRANIARNMSRLINNNETRAPNVFPENRTYMYRVILD